MWENGSSEVSESHNSLWRDKKMLGAKFSPNKHNYVVRKQEKALFCEICYVLAAHVQL